MIETPNGISNSVNISNEVCGTAMDFARMIPDWNSLDSVRSAHSILEGAALALFAFLVLFDVLAHLSDDKAKEKLLERIALCFFGIAVLAEIVAFPYGQQNDALSGKIISSLDAKAESALDKSVKADNKAEEAEKSAETAHEEASEVKVIADEAGSEAKNALAKAQGSQREADLAKSRIDSANTALSKLEERLKARRLSTEQKDGLVKTLAGITAPSPVPIVGWVADAFDGQAYAGDFVDVLNDPRIHWNVARPTFQIWSAHEAGVFVVVHDPKDVIPQAESVIKALKLAGVEVRPWVDPNSAEHSFEIRIGAKE